MNTLKELFSDENGTLSSKRMVGFLGAVCLFINMFIHNKAYSVDAVLIISLGSLGISGVEAIMQNFGDKTRTTKKKNITKIE
jgi:predicted membrane channel-forming protein YqfA (hemolysin III family)